MVAKSASVEAKRKSSQYNTTWKAAHRAASTEIATKIRKREKEYANVRAGTGPGYRALWLSNTKARAKKKGLPFDLTLEDLFFPKTCPVLGIPLVERSGSFSDNSPSLDRTVPTQGYVKGNVAIMSYRANRIKCHATLAELKAIVAYMERLT